MTRRETKLIRVSGWGGSNYGEFEQLMVKLREMHDRRPGEIEFRSSQQGLELIEVHRTLTELNFITHTEILSLKMCGKVQGRLCSPDQWILRCKFTDSNCPAYYATCRFNMSSRIIICDPTLHARLECCDVQCRQ